MSGSGRGLPSLIVLMALTSMVALTGAPAWAQNMDQGKSAAKLFSESCAECHHRASGLAKGRFSWTLSSFLQQHYTSNSTTAQLLAAYLQSVDAPRAKPQPPAGKSKQAVRHAAAAASPRPPAPVPAR